MNIFSLDKFQSISIDSRTLCPGDVFVAICGPNFDGHNFVLDAERKGAVAAIVSRDVECNIPTIKVKDTLAAFGELATLRRKQVDIPIIALTGSCGKTTTKSMLASILSKCGNTLSTEANLNNNIGVPLTLLRLKPEHNFAVLEVGANMVHEIKYSANLIKPSVAMITNVGHVHLKGFSTLSGVAKVKGDILSELASDGIAVLNADDKYFDYWRSLLKGQKVLSFGVNKASDITAEDIVLVKGGEPNFLLKMPIGNVPITLQLLGEHNVKNALAAATAAYAVGIPLESIKAGLESTEPVAMRAVRRKGFNNSVIIDDSYSANPESMKAAMSLLAKAEGEKIMIVGDMLELAGVSEYFHYNLGLEAKELGINKVFGLGIYTHLTVKAFGEGGYYFDDNSVGLVTAVKKCLNANTTVLVKGSNANCLWDIVDCLLSCR